jgi:hypothetical protein
MSVFAGKIGLLWEKRKYLLAQRRKARKERQKISSEFKHGFNDFLCVIP